MRTTLAWKPCQWRIEVEAMRASGLLYMVISSKRVDASGSYFATARANMFLEPPYLGRFPNDSAGLDAAQAACQAFEDVSAFAHVPE
jgi:hypothetical protein